jgi:hypothetical protein
MEQTQQTQQTQQIVIPQVPRQEVINFSKVWTKGGIVVPMQDIHIDFAVDFANVVLKSFVLQCHAQVQAAVLKAQQTMVQEAANFTGVQTNEVSKQII